MDFIQIPGWWPEAFTDHVPEYLLISCTGGSVSQSLQPVPLLDLLLMLICTARYGLIYCLILV